MNNNKISKLENTSLSEIITFNRNDIMEIVKKTIDVILNENNQDELIAYHGSVANFNKFDLSKVGSGEGSQVYGWGVYLTNVKDTGRYYAATIALKHVSRDKDNTYKHIYGYLAGASSQVLRHMNDDNYLKKRVNVLNNLYDKYNKSTGPVTKEKIKSAIDMVEKCETLEQLKNLITSYAHKAASKYDRYVYTVDIPDEKCIFWNSTNKNFITKMYKLFSKKFDTSHVDINTVISFGDLFEKLRGWNKPSELKANGEIIPQKELSLYLYSLGYKGIKVPTGNKRGGDGRGFNYVIFNSDDVKIVDQTNMKGKENF
jgi:hypothetical protein